MNDIECPYCEEYQKINHDDGAGYDEDKLHQQQCDNCDKIFTFTTYIIYSYEAFKADCLNGSEHDYRATHTIPREYTKMRCSMCDEERTPTKQEMDLILNYLITK